VIVTRHGKGSFVAESGTSSLAGELQDQKLDEHLTAAAEIAQQLGLSSEELAARLRRALKDTK
jgi:GntR family transcriptional regulator